MDSDFEPTICAGTRKNKKANENFAHMNKKQTRKAKKAIEVAASRKVVADVASEKKALTMEMTLDDYQEIIKAGPKSIDPSANYVAATFEGRYLLSMPSDRDACFFYALFLSADKRSSAVFKEALELYVDKYPGGIPDNQIKPMAEVFGIQDLLFSYGAFEALMANKNKVPDSYFYVFANDGERGHVFLATPKKNHRAAVTKFTQKELHSHLSGQILERDLITKQQVLDGLIANNQSCILAKRKNKQMNKPKINTPEEDPQGRVQAWLAKFLSKGSYDGYANMFIESEFYAALKFVMMPSEYPLSFIPKTLPAVYVISMLRKRNFKQSFVPMKKVQTFKYQALKTTIKFAGNSLQNHHPQVKQSEELYTYDKNLMTNVRLISTMCISDNLKQTIMNLYSKISSSIQAKTAAKHSKFYVKANNGVATLHAPLQGSWNSTMSGFISSKIGLTLEDVANANNQCNGHYFLRSMVNKLYADNINAMMASITASDKPQIIILVGSKFTSDAHILYELLNATMPNTRDSAKIPVIDGKVDLSKLNDPTNAAQILKNKEALNDALAHKELADDQVATLLKSLEAEANLTDNNDTIVVMPSELRGLGTKGNFLARWKSAERVHGANNVLAAHDVVENNQNIFLHIDPRPYMISV